MVASTVLCLAADCTGWLIECFALNYSAGLLVEIQNR